MFILPILQPPLSLYFIPSSPYLLESPAKFNFILEAWIVFCQMTDCGQPGGQSIGHGLSTEMHSPDSWPRGHLVLNHLCKVLLLFFQKIRAKLAFNLIYLRILQRCKGEAIAGRGCHVWQGSSFVHDLCMDVQRTGETCFVTAAERHQSAPPLNAAAVISPQRFHGCHWSDIT